MADVEEAASGIDAWSRAESFGSFLLGGIVGSRAYGLGNEESDTDRLGIFAGRTIDLCALGEVKLTHSWNEPEDTTVHEAGKYARLALGCNPTAYELLWLESYEHISEDGQALVDIRSAFLSAGRVKDAYLGYAKSQLNRLHTRGDGTFSSDTRRRSGKHARHMARLLEQGRGLYESGTLTITVSDPDWYHDFSLQGHEAWSEWFTKSAQKFETSRSRLPEHPDTDTVDRWLRRVRQAHL